jgi:PD-(D/E)XK nuclease superfamily
MQLQTYLRMSGLAVGRLLNFHALRLKDGPRRFVG